MGAAFFVSGWFQSLYLVSMELEFQGVAFQASGAANEDLSITMGDGLGSRAWYVDFMKLQGAWIS